MNKIDNFLNLTNSAPEKLAFPIFQGAFKEDAELYDYINKALNIKKEINDEYKKIKDIYNLITNSNDISKNIILLIKKEMIKLKDIFENIKIASFNKDIDELTLAIASLIKVSIVVSQAKYMIQFYNTVNSL